MKFITEEDLRDLYKTQPFTDYDLKEGERLTPGARQFLVDRRINICGGDEPCSGAVGSGKKIGECTGKPSGENAAVCGKFQCRIKSLKALFLLTAGDMIDSDVCMSRQLTELCRNFSQLGAMADGKGEAADICPEECSGMKAADFSKSMGDCFEITEFHMQMDRGRDMIMLARLRSELELFCIETEELICDGELSQKICAHLNQIINTLSQMICKAMGGKECQRKG